MNEHSVVVPVVVVDDDDDHVAVSDDNSRVVDNRGVINQQDDIDIDVDIDEIKTMTETSSLITIPTPDSNSNTINDEIIVDAVAADFPSSTTITTSDDTNSSSSSSSILKILHNLPPLPKVDVEIIVNDVIIMMNMYINNNHDKEDKVEEYKTHIIESFWNDYSIRTCTTTTTNHSITTSTIDNKKQQQQQRDKSLQEYIIPLHNQIQEYQSSLYGNKNCVTAKFSITIEEEKDVDDVQKSTTIVDQDVKVRGNNETNVTDGNIVISTAPNIIVLRTYVEYIDTLNFCNGSWRTCWYINIINDITASITGSIHIHTYYYEQQQQDIYNNMNNSQSQLSYMLTNKTIISLQEEKVNSLVAKFEKSTMSYVDKLITKIVQYIIQQEQVYYNSIITDDDNETTTTLNTIVSVNDQLRSLRRILPITKQKFNWSSINKKSSTSTTTTNIMKQKHSIQQQFMMHNNNNNTFTGGYRNKIGSTNNTTTSNNSNVTHPTNQNGTTVSSFAFAAAAAAAARKK